MLFPEKLLVKFWRMKMTPRMFLVAGRVLLLALLPVRVFADDATNQWKVQVVGVMVVAPAGGKDHRSYCWKPGVTVSASLSPAAGKIVKLNQEESKIDSFTDDKGTDLLAAPSSNDPFNKPGISFLSLSTDGGDSSVIIDLKASGQPAKGATVLNISGKVNAQVAGSTKQFTVENVEIKTNAQFSLGDLAITISHAGLSKGPFSKTDEFSVTFSSPQNLESIAKLEFYDAQGIKLEAQKRSWGGGFLGYMVEYVFKKSADHARIVATCWQDLKTVDVPVSVKTGVGL